MMACVDRTSRDQRRRDLAPAALERLRWRVVQSFFRAHERMAVLHGRLLREISDGAWTEGPDGWGRYEAYSERIVWNDPGREPSCLERTTRPLADEIRAVASRQRSLLDLRARVSSLLVVAVTALLPAPGTGRLARVDMNGRCYWFYSLPAWASDGRSLHWESLAMPDEPLIEVSL